MRSTSVLVRLHMIMYTNFMMYTDCCHRYAFGATSLNPGLGCASACGFSLLPLPQRALLAVGPSTIAAALNPRSAKSSAKATVHANRQGVTSRSIFNVKGAETPIQMGITLAGQHQKRSKCMEELDLPVGQCKRSNERRAAGAQDADAHGR